MPIRKVFKKKPKVARNVQRYVKKTIKMQAEHKRQTLSAVDATNFNTTGAIVPLAQISQGIEEDQRIGDKCKIVKFEFRGFYQPPTTGAPSTARIIFFWDNMAQGVAPTFSDATDTNGVLLTKVPHAQYSDHNRENKRYHILKDIMLPMGFDTSTEAAGTTTAYVQKRYMINFKINLNHVIEFYGQNGTTQTNLSKGQIYMLYLTDLNTTGTIGYYSALTFTDI